MDRELAYDISVHLDAGALAWAPLALPGWPAGADFKPLRRFEDGALRSALVRLPEGWSSGEPLRSAVVQQLFVVAGRLRLGDVEIGPDGFFVVEAGAVMDTLTAQTAVEGVLILDGAQAYTPAPAADGAGVAVLPDAYAVEPFTPVIEGVRLDGFERRVLWRDPATGADTRLLRVPGGFKGAGPNWHPVHEEILCLEGDIAPDDSRLMKPGHFLWNPAYSVHGFREHSNGGCIVLEWHDGEWSRHQYAPAEDPA
jgi:hypothetical protein